MTRIDENTRIIGGNIMNRRFAYLHKKDRSKFGLLMAMGARDARNYLGPKFYIRPVWLTMEQDARFMDRDEKWEIVASVFLDPKSTAYIGKKGYHEQ